MRQAKYYIERKRFSFTRWHPHCHVKTIASAVRISKRINQKCTCIWCDQHEGKPMFAEIRIIRRGRVIAQWKNGKRVPVQSRAATR